MDTLQNAWQLFEDGDLAQAERLYRQVLAVQPKQTMALHGLGYVLAGLGQFDQAESCYLELLHLARHNNDEVAAHRAMHQLGMVQRMAGRYEEALISLQTEAEIMPSDTLAQSANAYEQGNVNLKMGNYTEAEPLMEQALQYALSSGDKTALACALRGTGELYLAMGLLREAQGFLEQAKQTFLEAGDRKGAGELEALLDSI